MDLFKKLFDTNSNMPDAALLGLRVFSGIAMLAAHGWGKLLRLTSGAEISFADPFHIGATTSLVLAVFAEALCAILLVLGLFHRVAAFFLSFTMATAAFIVKAGDPFSESEKAFLYLAIFLFLIFSGPGRLSLDHYIFNRKK